MSQQKANANQYISLGRGDFKSPGLKPRDRADSEASAPGQTRSVLKSKLRSTQLALDETEIENERLRHVIDRRIGVQRDERDRLFSGEYADDELFDAEEDDEVEIDDVGGSESDQAFERRLSATAAAKASQRHP